MKTFPLLAICLGIALAPTINAEDRDEVKAPKNRAKAPQSSQYVAPRVPAKTQRYTPAAPVGPKVNRSANQPNVQPYRRVPADADMPRTNRWSPPANQPNVQPYRRVPADADMPRTNRWSPHVSQPNVQADARVHANPDMPRTVNRAPQTTAAIHADVNARNRNWDNTRNWNNNNWRNRLSYNSSWAEACRRHGRHYHHRDWWRSRYGRFALFGTGYYFWDNGYWFPAYGYDPAYSTYAYEEPIYGYGGLEPAQVIANVQTELQRLGYFPYAVDGWMGPMTRAAIANYQRDNGLAITSAIDEPTLESLGLE